MTYIQLLLALGGNLHFTTWHRDFTYLGQVFKSAGALTSVSFPSHSSESREESLSFSIALTADPESGQGPRPCKLWYRSALFC